VQGVQGVTGVKGVKIRSILKSLKIATTMASMRNLCCVLCYAAVLLVSVCRSSPPLTSRHAQGGPEAASADDHDDHPTIWDHSEAHGHGPSTWARNFPLCGGKSQSPIDLRDDQSTHLNIGTPEDGEEDSKTDKTVSYRRQPRHYSEIEPPTLYGAGNGGRVEPDIPQTTPDVLKAATMKDFAMTRKLSGVLVNNGHTIQFNSNDRPKMVINSPILTNQTFELLQIHFHWGSTNGQGSEHTIESKSFPMEMHAVHKNVKYTVEEAVSGDFSDSLMVLGFMIDVSTNYKAEDTSYGRYVNPQAGHSSKLEQAQFKPLSQIVEGINTMEEMGTDQVDMADFNLMAFVKSVDFESFYHYSGSLTTPPCTEVVTWVVFDKPIVAGPRQLEAFRKVQVQHSKGRSGDATENLEDNWRPVQSLNGRSVFHFSGSSSLSVSGGEEPRSRRYVSYVKGHYKKISKKDNPAKASTVQSAHTRVLMNQTQQDSNETTLSQRRSGSQATFVIYDDFYDDYYNYIDDYEIIEIIDYYDYY